MAMMNDWSKEGAGKVVILEFPIGFAQDPVTTMENLAIEIGRKLGTSVFRQAGDIRNAIEFFWTDMLDVDGVNRLLNDLAIRFRDLRITFRNVGEHLV